MQSCLHYYLIAVRAAEGVGTTKSHNSIALTIMVEITCNAETPSLEAEPYKVDIVEQG